MTERLTRRDAAFIALCLALAAASVAIVIRYWETAFPEATIDFKVDRGSSRDIAETFLRTQGIDVSTQKHAVRFDSDDAARIFLERTLGLVRANRVLRDDIRVWAWHHRWFTPLREEEFSVDVAPTGEIIGYTHTIPEDRVMPGAPDLRRVPFLTPDLQLVDRSERRLPGRVQRIFTFESKTIRPGGAPYRHTLTFDGARLTGYTQHLKVPETWLRSYREMRSKNVAAGSVDLIFMVVTMIAAVVIFVIRLRRGELALRFLLVIGIVSIVLVTGVALNSLPGELASYDTNESWPAFVGWQMFQVAMNGIGTAMLLIVICGSGEVLYRSRLPQHLAIPRLATRKALASKRVFLSMILGYALVPMFIAYQVIFYLVAQRFGAWSPAEVAYDELLNSAIPWVAVLFAGFFPAFSEEFLSRAFSIPLFERVLRSRWIAIIAAAFIWGFGHATYPNQPFWVRGVEVGLAGVVAGVLMFRFGLLPLLIWHYTIDAVYTATLLFASGNTYYVVSAALASLIFVVPLLLSIARYVRKGFVPDDDLTNQAMPVAAPAGVEASAATPAAHGPGEGAPGGHDEIAAAPLTRRRVMACVALIIAAIVAVTFRPTTPQNAVDYRMTKQEAKDIARLHVRGTYTHLIATPVEGFRSWDERSSREDGGAPADFDAVAATYLLRNGMTPGDLVRVFREDLEAGTWIVRFFTPLQKDEVFVEVDPRTTRIVGYHKYQDEAAPGPSLPRELALARALRAFGTYGVDPRRFELKEALSFQQPSRRDWLFHFEERTPLAARAFRRVTVRVCGAEVTQFNKHVKIPEAVYRDASTQTLLNVTLFVLQVIGYVTLFALVVTGIVLATRAHGLPWRRALRWTLILSVIPLASIASQYEEMLFSYSTTLAWETFRVSMLTHFVRNLGLQLGVLFLALAGLEAAFPSAPTLLTREGRSRFGRAAVVAALTAVSIVTLASVAMEWARTLLPQASSIAFGAPIEVAIPLPGIVEVVRAAFAAVIVSGAVALIASALRKRAAVVIIAAVFCVTLQPSALASEMPLMLAKAAATAVLVWAIARYVLGRNPLAWPLAIFLATSLGTFATLVTNHRGDLLANAVLLIVIVAAAVFWIGRRDARVV